MKRHFNYTGRVKIPRSAIRISLHPGATAKSFSASLDLSSLGLPRDAEVFVEAYYKRTFMRFPYGSIEIPKTPEDTHLTDLESGSQVYFRIKVVESGADHGRIVASADGIRASMDEEEIERESILPVNFKDDMEELPCRLHIDPASGPVLEVNNRIPGAKEYIATDPVFRALVYPGVVREVLREIASQTEGGFDVEEGTWQHNWTRFASQFVGSPPPTDDIDALDDWLDELMDSVAKHLRLQSNLTVFLRGSDDHSSVD